MAMRAIRTRGGPMIPVRLSYRLYHRDLVNLLCWGHRESQTGDELPEMSRAEVIECVRETLRCAGPEKVAYWGDVLTSERYDEVEAWAERLIDRTYGPALDGAR